jgi:hypothetical protein
MTKDDAVTLGVIGPVWPPLMDLVSFYEQFSFPDVSCGWVFVNQGMDRM